MLVDPVLPCKLLLSKLWVNVPPALEAARAGAEEIQFAVVAGNLTTLVVLVPLLFLYGFIGKTFGPLAATLITPLPAPGDPARYGLAPALPAEATTTIPLASRFSLHFTQ